MRVFRTYTRERLTDEIVSAVQPPPPRCDCRTEYGLRLPTAVDVYFDTHVRSLGLWVDDRAFKYLGVRPRRLPAGVSANARREIEEYGIMIGPPNWVSKSRSTVLTVAQAREEAKRLIALVPSVEVWQDGTFDPDGVLFLDYNPPRLPRTRARKSR